MSVQYPLALCVSFLKRKIKPILGFPAMGFFSRWVFNPHSLVHNQPNSVVFSYADFIHGSHFTHGRRSRNFKIFYNNNNEKLYSPEK